MKACLRSSLNLLIGSLALSSAALHAAEDNYATEGTPSYLPTQDDTVKLENFQVNAPVNTTTYTADVARAATKTDTPLVNVPQAITVITRELIDDQGMTSMKDLARYVPGMGIAQGEGNRDTPVMRGNSTTADFFIDGVRDDVQYLRDLYNMDRVEVLKGPNAMIFGRGGSGGVVNRVTKQANGAAVHELDLTVGSWDQYRATLDYGDRLNSTTAYRFVGLYEDSHTYRSGTYLKRFGLNPSLLLKVGPRTTLRTGYEYFRDDRTADRGVSSYQGRPLEVNAATFFGDPARSVVWARVHSAFATLDHRFDNGITLRNQSRFGSYRKFYQNVFPGAVSSDGTKVAISGYNNRTDRDNFFNQTDVVLPFATGPLSHQVLAGLEVSRQETDNFRNTAYFTSVSPTTTSVQVALSNPVTTLPITWRQSATDADNHGVAKTVAVYAQDQVQLLKSLQAIAGVRLERFDIDFDNHRTGDRLDNVDNLVSPRAGLVYKPAENVSVYGSYSMSNIPRAGEQLASLTVVNSSLKPEEFQNREVGVKWDVRPDFALTAAFYHLDRKNVAITDPADSTRMLLVDGQMAEGVEFGFTGRVTKNWSTVGGYAYQEGEIKTTQSATVVAGARLAQLPRHTFSVWNRYDVNSKFGAGLGVIYRDELFAATDGLVRVPSFVRFDAALFYRVSKNLRVQLNVENLLDTSYYSAANSNTNISPGSPRAFRLTLTTLF